MRLLYGTRDNFGQLRPVGVIVAPLALLEELADAKEREGWEVELREEDCCVPIHDH